MKKEEEAQKQQSRVKNETLESCTDKLRDAYMNYKDLVHRCIIDIKQVEKGENRVFYFKPETFLLEDPEKQRIFREQLLKKIQQVPYPEPIQYMGDELHRQLLETVQDKSQPTITRKNLALFFKRKHYNLQHKKYKLLIRWAHHALTTEYMERIGHEATFRYGKMEYDMENAMNRCERLDGDDDFDGATTYQRPNTKAKEGGSLYVEKTNLEPVSSIRMDDIEVYLRQATYYQKINRLINKFLSRLKWLPLYRRALVKKVRARGELIIPKSNDEMFEELQLIIDNYNVTKHRAKITNKAEAIMQSQKSDHEFAPMMIDNSLELKVHILEKALDYGIYGDIELDQGYSFAYQITIFFPTYFQRQIIKSQFSLYDAFAGEVVDQNNVQKRNLQNMIKIDTNIFRDISTTKHNIPTQESLHQDSGFQNINVVRLKSAAYWIDYVCVFSKVSTCLQKQAAFFSTNNPIDSLLRSAMNFLDVNDLATVNRILEETARLHQQQQKDKFNTNSKTNKKKKNQPSFEGKKLSLGDQQKASKQNEAYIIKEHFSSALKGDVSNDQQDPLKDLPSINTHSLRYLPQHLIHAYYILRHMKSRDYKTKLLYCLNYFRTIQKRTMLDLREFGTRERILGDVTQPLLPADEANKVSQQNANANYFKHLQEAAQMAQKQQNQTIGFSDGGIASNSSSMPSPFLLKSAEQDDQKDKEYSIFKDGQLKKEISIIDMKQYKFKGTFCNKIFSTCPIIPQFHATFGEPIEFQPLNVEMERVGAIKHATDNGVKLMGRVDHIEINEKTKEVYIKDDFGIHIMYECALADMKDLEEELLKIGSYYISKHEFLVNTENEKPYPVIDRITLIEDLLCKELDFQFQKVHLIQAYMESYEHISDPLEQQRLIQVMIDIIGQRPRLNLKATYFKDSYDVETLCLQKHTELLKTMIANQMAIEKEENMRTQAYLDLTYRIANEQLKGRWTYADAEDFFNELKKRRATINRMKGEDTNGTIEEEDAGNLNVNTNDMPISIEDENGLRVQQQQQDEDQSPTKKFLNKIKDKQFGSKYSQANQYKGSNLHSDPDQEPGFAAVLGLPPITVESLYMQYKEKDEVIIDIMNENANFVRIYEGYPDFLVDLQGLQSQKLCQYKFSNWSQPINILDFYESLTFVPKFYATLQSILNELEEVLKPHDSNLLSMIELKVLERAEVEYKKSRAFLEGDIKEYGGADYLEDESIVGNSDKITFYVKDFVSHLQKTLKPNINPFYIGKLDIETINFFDYTQLPKEQNPYIKQKPQIQEDMDASVKIADTHVKPNLASYQRFFPNLKEYMRKINIPSMLTLYCNSIEMLRLRQELINAMSESMLLQEIYESQCKLVNRQNFKALFNDNISFDNYLIDATKVNYIDDGPGRFIDYNDLGIIEFDPLLKSNLNFRSPDAVKMMICSSGLEELRAILHYQIMQKQLLIIGVRMNQLLIDTHVRAINELELVKKGYSLPNMIIKVQNVLSKAGDGFSYEGFQKERQKYMTNLVNEAAPVFYYVGSRKTKLRNTVSKKFSVFLTSVASTFSKVECSLRVLRAYKIKLLHSYCKEVMKEAYHDSMRIQAISTCQKLRTMAQIFSIDDNIVSLAHGTQGNEKPQIFQYEVHDYLENFFCAYNPALSPDHQTQIGFSKDQGPHHVPCILPDTVEIVDFFMIPSSITLAKCEVLSYEELQALNQKYPSFEFVSNPDDNDPEKSIKDILPKIQHCTQEYPKEDPEKERQSLRIVDFKNNYDYSNTNYSKMYTYYAMVERIFTLEYFMAKMTANLLDSLELEESIFKGMPFWSIDPEMIFSMQKQEAQANGNDKLAEKILNKIVVEKRAKVNLADDIINLSQILQGLITRIQNSRNIKIIDPKQNVNPNFLNKQKINEYLITYQEFKFYFLLYTIEKLIDSYYEKASAKEVKFLSDVQQALIRKDHIKTTFKHNAFHVNSSYTRPEQLSIDASNLWHQYYPTYDEAKNFQHCVQPIINEAALNPPQITIYEGMYMNQSFKSTQFTGQIPHYPRVYQCLETACINLSEHERQYINSTAHSIKGFLKDYLEVIHRENVDFGDEGLQFDQLKKCKKFLGDLIQARQLKTALICWLSCSTVPLDPSIYNSYLAQFKNDIFWKIMNEKDSLPAPTQQQSFADSNNMKQPTFKGEQSAAADRSKKSEQNMLLTQQLQNMQNQVLIDQVQTCKAEIIVLSNEIERQIVKAAIKAVEDESAALANCFSLSVKQIDMHIHPFQQFASTLYAQVDQNSHLDMVTKVAEVQRFITKLRNRGTEVETLTSGPGMVFTVKDFNECLQILCRGLIKYAEKELRSRSEELSKKESHYIQLLYNKDRRIQNLEERITNTRENLDKLINSKMYEKGNQLIYELDHANRQLRLFKDNVFAMERELKSTIRAEFADTIRKQMRDIDISKKRFKDFKSDVTTKVKADLAQEQHIIQKVIKKKAEEFKNLSLPTSYSQKQAQYNKQQMLAANQPTILHNNEDQPYFSAYLDEINQMTEREAREELAQMWDLMRKLRIFWKTKEVLTIDKYEKELFTLKKQLTSNACLWEQLAEAEKREKVLKQELVFTQQSLAASEKVIEKLKDDLRKSESDRIRLNQYKSNKQERLEELEGKVRKFEVMENINLEKLIDTLGNKEKEIVKLKDVERNFHQRLDAIEKRKGNEIRDMKGQYQKELVLKKDVLERLEGLRMELRMLEKNEGSMAEVWKSKCKELVDICNKLKQENDSLRNRLYTFAQNISQFTDNEHSESKQLQQPSDGQQFILPKLMSNNNQGKMLQNIQASKYGSSAHTRHSSTVKNDSQFQGASLERSLIGPNIGILDTSLNQSKQKDNLASSSHHNRGKSMHDNAQSLTKITESSFRLQQQMQQNIIVPSTKINSQRFAVLGQQAAIAGKGYQSVRTSQVEGINNNQLRGGTDEMSTFMNNNLKYVKHSGVQMTNTATSFNNNFISGINLTAIGKSPAEINQSSDIKSSAAMESAQRKSRLSTERYQERKGSNAAAKRKSNMDLSQVVQTDQYMEQADENQADKGSVNMQDRQIEKLSVGNDSIFRDSHSHQSHQRNEQ